MQTLQVLIKPCDLGGKRVFIAQCLEFDIVVQGDTPQDSIRAFLDQWIATRFLVESRGVRDPYEYMGRAPPEVWQAWDTAFKGLPSTVKVDGGLCVEPALAYA